MKRAWVKGEAHYSDSDLSHTLSPDFSDYDSVFIEHHEVPGEPSGLNPGMLLFITAFTVFGKIISKTYHTNQEIKERCIEHGMNFEDNIDLNGIETYQELGLVWRLVIPIGVLLVSLLSMVITIAWLPAIVIGGLLPLDYTGGIILFLISFVVLENGAVEAIGTYSREQSMIEEILRRSDRKGYTNIIVVCGELHRPMIGYLLQSVGWKVEQCSTNSRLRLVYYLLQKSRLWILVHLRTPTIHNPN